MNTISISCDHNSFIGMYSTEDKVNWRDKLLFLENLYCLVVIICSFKHMSNDIRNTPVSGQKIPNTREKGTFITFINVQSKLSYRNTSVRTQETCLGNGSPQWFSVSPEIKMYSQVSEYLGESIVKVTGVVDAVVMLDQNGSAHFSVVGVEFIHILDDDDCA